MLNALRVLGRDLLRLAKTPAALVVVIVLVVLPSTYTWFNVIGFWNPYDNTGNMRVCVVNEDAGGDNELMGSMNLGNQIVDTLHENTQLQWDFMSYDEAMEEVQAGRAYAAFVIPSDFTSNLFTILSGDFQQPNIQYYVNEKINPVSPKVTDAGSSTLDETINSEFVSTVSSVVADTLNDKVADAESDLAGATSDTADQLRRAKDSIADTRTSVGELARSTSEAKDKASSAQSQLSQARSDAKTVEDQLQQVSDLTDSMQSSIMNFTSVAMPGLSKGNLALSQAAANATTSINSAASSIEKAEGTVEASIARAEAVIDMNNAIIKQLQSVYDTLPDTVEGSSSGDGGFDPMPTPEIENPEKVLLAHTISDLTDRNERLQRAIDDLDQLSRDTSATAAAVSGAANSLNGIAQNSINAASGYQTQLFGTALPQVSTGLSQVGASAVNLKAAIANQGVLIDQASAVVDQLASTLDVAVDSLKQTDSVLRDLEDSVGKASTDVSLLSTSNTVSSLIDNGRVDPEKIAEFMQSPTKVTTEKLYPVNAYGTAMSPLFISLSLWVGTLMLCVILKLEVDKEGIPGLTVVQGYIGRWMFFAILVALQAIVCVSGCLFIGVEPASVSAFYVTAVLLSLTYLSITYALSSCLQHIGIGLCIIMVFVQIPGGTGLYPVEMTDAFFRAVYPMFPFTYGINALRETLGGFYGSQYASYVGVMMLIMFVMTVVGLFARPQLTNLNRLVAKQVAESDLLNGEAALVPERRYRIGQLIRALSDHEEFHDTMKRQAERFMVLYPRLKRGALIAGFVVPIIFTALFAVTMTEKVVILTAWLIWLVIVVAFLLVVESIRENIRRQAAIDVMSDDELRRHLANRGKKVVRELIPAAMTSARISVPLPSIMKMGDPGVSTAAGADDADASEGAAAHADEANASARDAAGDAANASARDAAGEASNVSARDAAAAGDATGGAAANGAAISASGAGESLMDLAAGGKQAVFEGPSVISSADDEPPADDEELLEVEAPTVTIEPQSLSALDLRHLRQRRRRTASVRRAEVAASEGAREGGAQEAVKLGKRIAPADGSAGESAGVLAASPAGGPSAKPSSGKAAGKPAAKRSASADKPASKSGDAKPKKRGKHDKDKKRKKSKADASGRGKKSGKKGQEGNHA